MYDMPDSTPTPPPSNMNRWLAIGGLVFVVISLVFIILSIIYPGFREAVRDLAIILLALFQLLGAIIMALVAVALLFAVKAIDNTARGTLIPKLEELSLKVDELLAKTSSVTDDVKKTSASVATTVTIISEQVVKPAIQVSSYVTGIKAAISVLSQRIASAATPPVKDKSDEQD